MNTAKFRNLNGEILTLEQSAQRVNLGVGAVRKYANECGAALKIGRAYRVNIQKLIDYLCTFEAPEDVTAQNRYYTGFTASWN